MKNVLVFCLLVLVQLVSVFSFSQNTLQSPAASYALNHTLTGTCAAEKQQIHQAGHTGTHFIISSVDSFDDEDENEDIFSGHKKYLRFYVALATTFLLDDSDYYPVTRHHYSHHTSATVASRYLVQRSLRI